MAKFLLNFETIFKILKALLALIPEVVALIDDLKTLDHDDDDND